MATTLPSAMDIAIPHKLVTARTASSINIKLIFICNHPNLHIHCTQYDSSFLVSVCYNDKVGFDKHKIWELK